MSAASVEFHEITYGPECPDKLRAILGEHPANISNDIYLQPYRNGYAIKDGPNAGKYAIKTFTKYGFSCRLFVYPTWDTYNRAWSGLYNEMPDPETGSYRKSA